MRKNIKTLLVLGLLLVMVITAGIFMFVKPRQDSPEVIASFYPLGHFAKILIPDQEVLILVPIGVEPHDFELSTQDTVKLSKSKLLIYNGNGFEPWVEDFLSTEEAQELKTLNVSQFIDSLEHEEDEHGEDEEEHEAEDGHEHGPNEFDPHFWLDPLNASKIINSIAAELKIIYPEKSAQIDENLAKYASELSALHSEYQLGLSSCQQDTIIVSHNAFSYLANRYNFGIISIAGISPESEPSAQKLAEISQVAKEKEVRHIFFETLVSPKLSETIANEVGAETLVLNPLENLTKQEQLQGEDYLSIMRKNLFNLQIALECQ